MTFSTRTFARIAALAFAAACSSSDSAASGHASPSGADEDGGAMTNHTPSSGGKGGSKGGSASQEPVGDDLTLFFNPMYSAYDGVHDFKLPVIVQGVQDVEWSASDPDAVDLEPDTTTGGVLLAMRKAGDFKIIARAGVLSGSADLHVTKATPEDWELGEKRYNNDIPFPMFNIPDGGFGSLDAGLMGFQIPDNLSCRNCHGAGAMALDVEHTPQQTGGYSDEELINIFTNGTKPEGAKFHTPFPKFIYMMYHTWDATDAEKKGIVVYLRSLEPKTQGPLDFQGLAMTFGGGGGAP